jgi:hypothetical protein
LGFSQTRIAQDNLKRALVHLARLKAELAHEAMIKPPEELAQMVGTREAELLISQQRTILLNNIASRDAKLTGNRKARDLATRELDGLKTQASRVADQLRLRQESSQKMSELQARGIVAAPRSNEEQIRVWELEEKASGVAVALARIHSVIAGLEREAQVLEQDHQTALTSQIGQIEREISHLKLQLDTETGAEFPVTASNLSYRIVQFRQGYQERVSAHEASPLRPGDVLLITKE